MVVNQLIPASGKFRSYLYDVIFKTDTRAGKIFDVVLLYVILVNIVVVMLDSVPSLQHKYINFFYWIEWIFTGLFVFEYLFRIISLKNPFRYIFSFYGLIDLLAILPSFLGIFISGTESLKIIRAVRLLRVFRVLKMDRFMGASNFILDSVKRSRHKLSVFFIFILTVVCVIGTIVYVVEGPEHGFDSIPKSIYWAIVTLTTVGYGDISPETPFGQFLASVVMLLGYVIIAVPTGLISAEAANAKNIAKCNNCHSDIEKGDIYCKHCGADQGNRH